ncbi:GNAT family N-acetyltransferase [Umezawaea beigongshangensis]|uniref:GNAT family N-acetyltransferase n=1 Tax=Umezawaea beigongshangensis TaxID=2780383 RepID=UPI0027DE9A5D|nr:N-acetyltransferase family protein [Umezawaea beigongshangensis]
MSNSAAAKPVIRAATAADLRRIAEIYAHWVTTSAVTFELTPPDETAWRHRFDAVVAAGLPFLVAELDGAVAGYAHCSPWKPREAYRRTAEDSIYLAPEAIGRGAGGVLLDALLDDCAAAGLREVLAVVVDTGNAASLELHGRRGFTEAGRLRRVGFKHGRWLDTVLLQRSLAPE